MSIPAWYEFLWACSALGYFAVCVSIVASRSLAVWPSVFAISLNRGAWFLIGRKLLTNYHLYFYGYYTEAWILTALDLWLAYDIYRAIPASRHFDRAFRKWTLSISCLTGVLIAFATAPRAVSAPEIWLGRIGVMFNLTLAGMAAAALGWFFVNGLGFSGTGFGIIAGALIRLSSSLVKSHAAASAKSHNLPMSKVIQTADLVVGLAVAVYWIVTLARSSSEEYRRRIEWERAADPLREVHHV